MLHFSDVLSRSFSMYTMNSDAYGCGRPQGGGGGGLPNADSCGQGDGGLKAVLWTAPLDM